MPHQMNPYLDKLQPYPFEKLARLKAGVVPNTGLSHIALSIGAPMHPTPAFLTEALQTHLHHLSDYPGTKGMPELRQAICDWLTRRFGLPEKALDAELHVLPVNGTREGLFAIAQAVIDQADRPLVVMPNPFYQIYEGAALLAGAEPFFLPCTRETGFQPDFDAVSEQTWERCQLLYTCSPGNPAGAVIPKKQLQSLILLAEKYDFVIAADECYSEIYQDEDQPPVGLLQAAAGMGHTDFKRCLVFHSLSKRSNAPGLRSGFVAGDADLIKQFLSYRTYHGCAMPLQHQVASLHAWRDEAHVQENRRLYREKFDAVCDILSGSLDFTRPEAGFYLWPETPIADEAFTRGLYEQQQVSVLPGSYLSRTVNNQNPGANRIRMALVAPVDECIEAANRIARFINNRHN